MRWLPYLILAYLAIGVQIGAGEALRFRGAKPDLVLLAVAFIAMNAPREAGLLGCFFIGLMTDLVTVQPLGLYALAYGVVGLIVSGSQEVVYREHPLSHLFLGLVGSLVVACVVLVHGWIAGSGRVPAGMLFGGALYTALLAPVVIWLLQRTRRAFSFQQTRKRQRGAF
jgi:rod shape-determining protein MreD